MRIAGIDPGYAIVGFGAVDFSQNRFRTVEYGSVQTVAGTPFDQRIESIYNELSGFFDRSKPDAVAIEKLFFNSNQKTAIDVAQARGVILLCAIKHGIPIFEYTPLQVKMSVVGYGRAEKKQVMEMTRIILGLDKVPKPDDTADALAIAICHAHSAVSGLGKYAGL
ncbi:MAG: crossover junction endodeoxyribonuclease RuvC [Oscillospiraceae bacterium]